MLSRLLFYGTYSVMASAAGVLLARENYDLIYCTSPPLTIGVTGLFLSKARRTSLVFEVRDLWPESAVTLGELRSERMIGWATRLEEACYDRARQIVVTTENIRRRIIERGWPEDAVTTIENGANVDLFQPDPESGHVVRQRLGIHRDQFLVVYAGLHGLVYTLETVVDVALMLPDAKFLLIGDGPTKAAVQAYALAKRAHNVHFLPAQPRAEIPAYFNAADVTVAPTGRNLPFGSVPIKIFDSLACETPVIAGAGPGIAEIMDRCGGGMTVEPENPIALRDALLELEADPERRQSLGAMGRLAVIANYSRKAQAAALVSLLESTLRC